MVKASRLEAERTPVLTPPPSHEPDAAQGEREPAIVFDGLLVGPNCRVKRKPTEQLLSPQKRLQRRPGPRADRR